MRKTGVLITATLVLVCTLAYSQQSKSAGKNANNAVSALAERIQACPATEVVVEFQGKWVKAAWGPVRAVKFKTAPTKDGSSPATAVIEFSVPYLNSEHRDTREQAEKDRDLNELFLSPVRYELKVPNNGVISVKSMRILNAASGKWDDYSPKNPERFCWIKAVRDLSR